MDKKKIKCPVCPSTYMVFESYAEGGGAIYICSNCKTEFRLYD